MDKKVSFLPFHAINEYMLEDYRQLVIQSVLGKFSLLSEERQRKINSLIKQLVKVQGFRNSSIAPLPLKINGCINAFSKSQVFAANIISAWADINHDDRQVVFDFLEERHWKLLPVDADRSLLPGFMIEWPKEDSFEILIQSFREVYPEISISDDDISLMVVWLSNRLPFEMVEDLFVEKEA